MKKEGPYEYRSDSYEDRLSDRIDEFDRTVRDTKKEIRQAARDAKQEVRQQKRDQIRDLKERVGEVKDHAEEYSNRYENRVDDIDKRARELKKEIAYVSSLLSRAGSASGASDRDSDVRSALLQLNAAVSAGSTSELDDLCMDLSSLLFGSATGTVSQGDLDALNAELHQLENAGAGRGSITAPAAGLFTSTTDGYESLTPDMLENLTPDGVDALERTTPATPANAIGKLVTAKKWYFASVMNKADADRLNLNGSATLDFPQHYTGTVSATVMSKSEPDDSGKVAVVFACNAALSDTLAMRKTTADVVYSEHTGLRVPLKAVHMDDDGQAFVYVVTAAQLEKKPIEIIYQTDDYCLVAQSAESNALRAGNEIVVTGKGLSNGQVVK